MDKFYDVVIIGGGPSGYTAALYCARAALKTLVIEELIPGGQMSVTDQIENYPGFNESVEGFALATKMKEGAERFGAETLYAKALNLSAGNESKAILTSKGPLTANAVILAMGAAPRKLGLPGERDFTGKGISYCATCDGAFFKDKEVVVVGGGNSAAGEALTLSELCRKVTLIHRGNALAAEQSAIDMLAERPNVSIIPDSEVKQLLYDSYTLFGVRIQSPGTNKARDLGCDGVFVAVGRVPSTALCAEFIDIDADGYVLADETTVTNIPGIFAIGDLRTKPVRQIITAAADGAVAAKFAEKYLRESR